MIHPNSAVNIDAMNLGYLFHPNHTCLCILPFYIDRIQPAILFNKNRLIFIIHSNFSQYFVALYAHLFCVRFSFFFCCREHDLFICLSSTTIFHWYTYKLNYKHICTNVLLVFFHRDLFDFLGSLACLLHCLLFNTDIYVC